MIPINNIHRTNFVVAVSDDVMMIMSVCCGRIVQYYTTVGGDDERNGDVLLFCFALRNGFPKRRW